LGLLEQIDLARIPRHVAIIMDGNGRWAKKRGLPRLMGHRAGTESVREAVKVCGELGVQHLTLYAFSTENWLRPASEVGGLMKLLVQTLRREVKELKRQKVRLSAIGRLKRLPPAVQAELARCAEELKDGTGLHLSLALNYGARQEIVDAVQSLLDEGARKVDEKTLSARLYTAAVPDPDLLIRTSGEHRLSNFLLWQCAYAEVYISPKFWPDFRRREIYEALINYQSRERRFGGI
jgi:undecaprenyl diphosphate synthase